MKRRRPSTGVVEAHQFDGRHRGHAVLSSSSTTKSTRSPTLWILRQHLGDVDVLQLWIFRPESIQKSELQQRVISQVVGQPLGSAKRGDRIVADIGDQRQDLVLVVTRPRRRLLDGGVDGPLGRRRLLRGVGDRPVEPEPAGVVEDIRRDPLQRPCRFAVQGSQIRRVAVAHQRRADAEQFRTRPNPGRCTTVSERVSAAFRTAWRVRAVWTWDRPRRGSRHARLSWRPGPRRRTAPANRSAGPSSRRSIRGPRLVCRAPWRTAGKSAGCGSSPAISRRKSATIGSMSGEWKACDTARLIALPPRCRTERLDSCSRHRRPRKSSVSAAR